MSNSPYIFEATMENFQQKVMEASASTPAPEAPRRFRLPQARAKLGQPAARSALAE